MKIQIILLFLLSFGFNKKTIGQVDLDPVIISCGTSTTTSVAISWNSIENAAEYIVKAETWTYLKIDTITDTHFEASGLDVSEPNAVEFTVTAVGKPGFNNSSETLLCLKQECPLIPIDLDPIPKFCFGDSSVAFLTYSADFSNAPSSGWGAGTYTFSGQGVAPSGVLDYSDVPVGDYEITVSYEEQSCIYSVTDTASVLEVKKIEPTCVANSTSRKVELSWNDVSAFNYNIWVNDIKIGSTDSTVFEFIPTKSNEDLKIWIEGFGYCNYPTDTLNCLGPILSSDDDIRNKNLVIHPNPANHSIHLDFSISNQSSYEFRLSDFSGQLVLLEKNISNKKEIDVSSLRKGMYFFSLKNNFGSIVKTGKIAIMR